MVNVLIISTRLWLLTLKLIITAALLRASYLASFSLLLCPLITQHSVTFSTKTLKTEKIYSLFDIKISYLSNITLTDIILLFLKYIFQSDHVILDSKYSWMLTPTNPATAMHRYFHSVTFLFFDKYVNTVLWWCDDSQAAFKRFTVVKERHKGYSVNEKYHWLNCKPKFYFFKVLTLTLEFKDKTYV